MNLKGTVDLEKGSIKGTVSPNSRTLNANMSSVIVRDFSGEIINVKDIYGFPNRGNVYTLYVVTSDNACYRWDEENSKYFCIGRDYTEIEIIDGGNA